MGKFAIDQEKGLVALKMGDMIAGKSGLASSIAIAVVRYCFIAST
ncbi:hypothetical protein FHW68_001077 [Pseudomonas sp. Tn43]|nr:MULTISPECIES: hypothetical protein [unclassified Pseudomonas]MBB3239586.1 hypothetical protein [Pseudomonas sp. Tn43]